MEWLLFYFLGSPLTSTLFKKLRNCITNWIESFIISISSQYFFNTFIIKLLYFNILNLPNCILFILKCQINSAILFWFLHFYKVSWIACTYINKNIFSKSECKLSLICYIFKSHEIIWLIDNDKIWLINTQSIWRDVSF